MGSVPAWKGKERRLPLAPSGGATCQPGGGPPSSTPPCWPPVLDFQPPELRHHRLGCKPPGEGILLQQPELRHPLSHEVFQDCPKRSPASQTPDSAAPVSSPTVCWSRLCWQEDGFTFAETALLLPSLSPLVRGTAHASAKDGSPQARAPTAGRAAPHLRGSRALSWTPALPAALGSHCGFPGFSCPPCRASSSSNYH